MVSFSRILVPVDLSPFSARSIEYAASLASMMSSSVTVMTVIQDVLPYFDFFPVEYTVPDYFPAMQEKAEQQMRDLVTRHGATVSIATAIRRGTPAGEIVEMASSEGFDLIVMATHGHSGFEHALLGSITEKVLRKAHCPVLVVR